MKHSVRPWHVVILQAALLAGLVVKRRRRRRAERAALGQLTASLAHELNQSLGAILLNAETIALLVERELPDLDQIKEIVEDIRKDDKRAAEVIERLRTLLHKYEIGQELGHSS